MDSLLEMIGNIVTSYLFLVLYASIVAHFFADFVFQNDKTAVGKSQNVGILFMHCIQYGMAMATAAILIFMFDMILVFWAFIVYTSTHFVIDYITSKLTTHYFKLGNRHMFFVVVGMDQMMHTTVIMAFVLFCLNVR